MARLRIDLRRIVAVGFVGFATLLVGFTWFLLISLEKEHGVNLGNVLPIAVPVSLIGVLITFGGWRLWHHG